MLLIQSETAFEERSGGHLAFCYHSVYSDTIHFELQIWSHCRVQGYRVDGRRQYIYDSYLRCKHPNSPPPPDIHAIPLKKPL